MRFKVQSSSKSHNQSVTLSFNLMPKGLGTEAFLSVARPTGVQLLVFICSSVPLLLFDTPGISRCRSQQVVSVESSSLFQNSIYP